MIKISKRLASIASLVPINSNIIDIGCDHALLDIYLYQSNKSNNIIASDVNANALANAKNNVIKYNLEDKIDVRLGNGLDTLNESDNIDTIIMSGIGAHTIIGILKNNINKLSNINTIIIESNNKLSFLRKEMVPLGFMIDDEDIVEDNNKIYIIIKFVKGRAKYTKRDIYFGPLLLKKNSPIFQKYLKKEYQKLNMILKLLPKNKLYDRYKTKSEIKMYYKIIDEK